MENLIDGRMMKKLPIGQKIRNCRLNRGWSQRKLAAKLGISYVVLCNYEIGKNVPGANIVQKILQVLSLPANQIIEDYQDVEENGNIL